MGCFLVMDICYSFDIAWTRLGVKPCTSPSLEINQERGWIVFRLPVL